MRQIVEQRFGFITKLQIIAIQIHFHEIPHIVISRQVDEIGSRAALLTIRHG